MSLISVETLKRKASSNLSNPWRQPGHSNGQDDSWQTQPGAGQGSVRLQVSSSVHGWSTALLLLLSERVHMAPTCSAIGASESTGFVPLVLSCPCSCAASSIPGGAGGTQAMANAASCPLLSIKPAPSHLASSLLLLSMTHATVAE